MGRWRGGATSRTSGAHPAGAAWFHPPKFVPDAAVLRDISSGRNCLTTGETITLTHNLIILNQSKRPEEREFYLRLAIRERWSKRELERQFKTALFERTVLNPVKVTPLVTQIHPAALSIFKDSYLVEFLDLPESHAEADLQRGLLRRLKDFLIELGRDFCFVGSEYPLQVGGRDFALDLLFFHRGLNCLVAIELKVGRFEPEYLGKLGFYLEALDRDAKNRTNSLPSAFCSAPARTMKSSNTP